MNIAGMAIDRRAIPMTRTRKGAVTWGTNGKPTTAASVDTTITAVIQPTRGNQLMDMPEGVRAEAGWMCWSRSDIMIDDIITHKGKRYRVLFDWPRDEGEFYRAALGLQK